jgi:hypothetical protein
MTTFTNDPITGELLTSPDSSSTDVTGGADGGDSLFSGLGGLFSSLGGTISSVYKSTQSPTTLAPGQTVLTANGQVITAPGTGLSAFTGSAQLGTLFLLGAAVLIVVLMLRSRG